MVQYIYDELTVATMIATKTFMLCVASLIALPARLLCAEDAPPTEIPTYRVGDIFEYVDRYQTIACKRWEITGRAPDGSWISQCGDNIAYFSADDRALLRIVGKDGAELVKFAPSAPAIPLPLHIGQRWGGRFRLSTAASLFSPKVEESCEVVAFETIRVVAGDLPAFRIDCSSEWSVWPLNGKVAVTMWYSLDANSLVKVVNGSDKSWDLELARYYRE
jgi:hypothetical protein